MNYDAQHAGMVDSILAHYDAAPREKRAAWLAWYGRERNTVRRIARTYGITRRQAAGIVACYSQNCTWSGNVTMVSRFLDNPTRPYGLGAAYRPAVRILAGERPLAVLTSDKLRNFYRNLAGDDNALTIDRWAARAAGVSDSRRMAAYAWIADAYREAARQRGERPAALQAIVWCQIRGTDA